MHNHAWGPLIAGITMPFVGVFCCAIQAHAGPPSFDTQTVRMDGEWNNPSSIAVDDDGVVHMAYMTQHHTDSNTKDIWYANNACGSWNHQQVTFNAVREEFPHLILDPQGNVHIAFHTGATTSNMIRYVNNIGSKQGAVTFNPIVDITGSGYKIVKHAIDSTDKVHFVYTSQPGNSSDDVFYNTWDAVNGVGTQLTINSTANGDSAPDVAIGPNDVVHIVWAAGSISGPLWYINNSSGSFQVVSTGVASSVQSPIILVSPGNVVNIVYRVGDLLWTVNNAAGGAFGPPQLVYGGSYRPSFYNKFALDADNLLHIAYASNANTDRGIFYIRQSSPGGAFQPPFPVLANPNSNQGVSLAIGPAGDVHVSYSLSGFDSKSSTVFANIFHAGTPAIDPCPADVTDSSGVDIDDLLAVINGWGASAGPADVTGNCVVDIDDLLAVINAWGPCG
jgi:hypothetical protein